MVSSAERRNPERYLRGGKLCLSSQGVPLW